MREEASPANSCLHTKEQTSWSWALQGKDQWGFSSIFCNTEWESSTDACPARLLCHLLCSHRLLDTFPSLVCRADLGRAPGLHHFHVMDLLWGFLSMSGGGQWSEPRSPVCCIHEEPRQCCFHGQDSIKAV